MSTSERRLDQIQGHLTRKTINLRDAYIVSAARTPTAKFNGGFKKIAATQLGAAAIKEALAKSNIPVDHVSDVYMGNVLQAGEGQAPARQAVLFAGLPSRVEAVTVNKVCASGLKAVMLAAQNVQMGFANAQIAGGMESMSQVPYYVPRASQNPAFGSMQLQDGLIKDGLWDVYEQVHMGNCAEHSAKKFHITREEQDAYAARSYKQAQQAWKDGTFNQEIVQMDVEQKKGETISIAEDEGYLDLDEMKLPKLKPAFQKDGTGTVTAANASSMNDGASAVVIASEQLAAEYSSNSCVLSKIVAYADAAVDPIDYSEAPAKAIKLALHRANLSESEIALWEINEAFASVVLITQKLLGIETSRVNVKGGAIALGHALGSSGSRILTTLVHQFEIGDYGVVALCNGGGASSAMVVQRVNKLQ